MRCSADYDVVVIGSGLYGIQAARYYLDIHPKANLLVLESDDVVGGVWSSKRVYDAFWTQTPTSMAEFSDRPLPPIPESEQYYNFFPAKYITAYLESYIDSHIYNGQSLRSRIFLNTSVTNISRLPDRTWHITCDPSSRTFTTPRLIDATGLTSLPKIPQIPGQDVFQGLAIHHKSFSQSTFLQDPDIQHIAVLGGAKSAADVAYAAAKAGKKVSWIIREEGNGPAAFLGAEGKGPYRNSNEGFYTRFVAAWLPNPFTYGRLMWGEWALHRTRVGRWVAKKMWDGVNKESRRKADYRRHEGKDMGFKDLEPDTPVFWQNDSSGVNQRPDFFHTIATKVHIYRQSINHLSSNSIALQSGKGFDEKPSSTVPVDVLVYCTGWTPNSPFYSPSMAYLLGLPVPLSNADAELELQWKELDASADAEVLQRFPGLTEPPIYRKSTLTLTPFRLYKAMAPVSNIEDHSIVFLGKMVVGNNFRAAEVQALWGVAYLDGNLESSIDHFHARSKEEKVRRIQRDVAMTVAWCRRRYLNKGELGNWYYFDMINYTDMLLAELGLASHKRGGWLRDLFKPCRAEDLSTLAHEYIARCKSTTKPIQLQSPSVSPKCSEEGG